MQGILASLLYHIVPFLFVLGLIVFVHELGHFLAAKRSGMTVHEFALGFGPVVFQRQSEGTQYSIRAVPLGGFVRIAGMEPGEDPNTPGGFNGKPFWARFATLSAGCAMNFVLATVIYIGLGMFVGVAGDATNRIERVLGSGVAGKAGIQRGDRIVAVDDLKTSEVRALRERIEQSPNKEVRLTIERDGRLIRIPITPEAKPADPTAASEGRKVVGRIGVEFETKLRRVGPVEAVVAGVSHAYNNTKLMVTGLIGVIGSALTGRASGGELGGPVEVMRITGEVAQAGGLAGVLSLAAMLSLNIGLLNLLPFPALDGARLVFLLYEGVIGRRPHPAREALVHYVGLLILLGLMLVVTIDDIREWIGGAVPH